MTSPLIKARSRITGYKWSNATIAVTSRSATRHPKRIGIHIDGRLVLELRAGQATTLINTLADTFEHP